MGTQKTHTVTATDRAAIEKIITECIDAWNRRSEKKFVKDFSDDVDLINLFGRHLSGKIEVEKVIGQALRQFFANSLLTVTNILLRELQQNAAFAIISWNMVDQISGKTREGFLSMIFVHSEHKWMIVHVQNTFKAD